MCTYDLKYNDYFTNLSDGLRSMLATADIADVTLAVEGCFFKTHQMVLSIFSPYFRELFGSTPCKHPIFFMKDVKYKVMKDLLTFMYEGKVQIPEEEFNDFINTAKALQVKGLTNMADSPSLADLPGDPGTNSKQTVLTTNLEEHITASFSEKLSQKRSRDSSTLALGDNSYIGNDTSVKLPGAKKSKNFPQVPVSSLSEISVVPVPFSGRKADQSLAKPSPPVNNIDTDAVNLVEVQMKDEHMDISDGNRAIFNLQMDNIDDLQYLPDDTIELDEDDDCYIKSESENNANNLQEDEQDLLEPLADIAADQVIGSDGEPVVVTFVRSRKGRSIIVNNYRYCIGDQSNYWTTWRCTKRRAQNQENCRAVVCLTRDYRIVLKNGHNHEAPAFEQNFPGAIDVAQRTCRASTMTQLNSWRCNLQREKERL